MDYGKEFQKYYVGHLGKGSLDIQHYTNHIESSLTPYILEERELRATQIDIFSRLLRDRILWCAGEVNTQMSTVVQAQLMYLDSVDKKDITMHVDSPGGSVLAGLGIVDVMNYITSDVATVNTGMCASMGSVLLSSGTKGKRSSLIFSKVMTHQVSHGTQGKIQDNRINQMEAEKYNYILFKMLANNCGKTFEEMLDFSERDRWYNSDEALKYGLIDEIIGTEKSPTMSKLLEGFDEYYNKQYFNK